MRQSCKLNLIPFALFVHSNCRLAFASAFLSAFFLSLYSFCCSGVIASYAFLTHLLAKHCGLEAFEFIYNIGNCHIYEEHINALKNQVLNDCYQFPTIEIMQVYENINDYKVTDFKINNYKCNDAIFMKIIA